MNLETVIKLILKEHIQMPVFNTGMKDVIKCCCGWSATLSLRSALSTRDVMNRHLLELIMEAINEHRE